MSKEKYNRLKEKANGWRDKAIEMEGEINRLTVENEELTDKVEELFNDKINEEANEEANDEKEELLSNVKNLTSQNKKLNKETISLKDQYDELQKQNDELLVQYKALTNDITKMDFNYEKIVLKKDTEIDRLSSYLDDYKERYREIREDNKELRKISR